MLKKIHEDWTLLKKSGRNIVAFEITYKLIGTAIAYPLLLFFIDMALNASGVKYLTNDYILKTVYNPVTWIIVLVAVSFFVFYCIYEMCFLSTCFESRRQMCHADMVEISYTALKEMKTILNIKYVPIILFYFISIIAVNGSIIANIILSKSNIGLLDEFVFGTGNKWNYIIPIGIVLIYCVVIPGIFTVKIGILENKSFLQSYKKSCHIVRKHWVGTISSVVLYNLAIYLFLLLCYILLTVVLVVGVKLLDLAYMGSAVYLSVLKYARTAFVFMCCYMAVPVSYTVITRMYYKCTEEDEAVDFTVCRVKMRYDRFFKRLYTAVAGVAAGMCVFYVMSAFNNNPFERIAIFHETKITAHRGVSSEAPENTIAAFEKAIEYMSDYIELDVQLTKDEEIVVFHDKNAYRTTGVNANICDLTSEEVKQLDAGAMYGEAYAGESVPTLKEVFDYIAGKLIKLNIEIKDGSNSELVAQKVIELIEEYRYNSQCVVTSGNYEALKEVKKKSDSIETGYIVTIGYGDFYNMKDVDFFCVNASILSKRMVDRIHNSGKKVCVWTVNDEDSIRSLSNKGVDNIITDNPVLVREVIYSRDSSETLLTMLKYVFNR